MFYLIKRVDEKQANVGDRCMVLADFAGIEAGTKGKVIEIYDEGLMIEWQEPRFVKGLLKESANGRPLADGFSRDELEYLAWETEKHPKVDATVNNVPPF